ncbi:protein of unknown function [Methanoculleus bourgensis]|uniref:Uncharacterized protein n=1 Tax=Methanoculleus bourgensis TaxID=83986 RepID=A0A0X3BL79_9EURY|nr:protein of unknown function [Methanoculleus bourgensis]
MSHAGMGPSGLTRSREEREVRYNPLKRLIKSSREAVSLSPSTNSREAAKIGLGYLQRPFAAFASSRAAVRQCGHREYQRLTRKHAGGREEGRKISKFKMTKSTSTPSPNYPTQLTPRSGSGARPHPGGVDSSGLSPGSGPWWLFALGEGAGEGLAPSRTTRT